MGLIKNAFMALHPWLFRPRLASSLLSSPLSSPLFLSAHGVVPSFIPGCPLLSFLRASVSVFACALCGRRPFDGGCLSSSTLISLRFYSRFCNERTNIYIYIYIVGRFSFKFGFVKIYFEFIPRFRQPKVRCTRLSLFSLFLFHDFRRNEISSRRCLYTL